MTADYYRNDITPNDTLARLLGLNLWEFRTERIDLLSELDRSLGYCATELEEAQKDGDEDAIKRCTIAVEEASQEFEHAGELYTKLVGEIAKARQGKPTLIVIVKDEPDDTNYDLVRISRQSLLDWIDGAKIKVGAAHPPPTRKHTTPLLDLLDELIGEVWEEYDGGTLPKKDAIIADVKKKYGDWTVKKDNGESECRIPDLSGKVMDSIITMMRPPGTRNQR